MGRFFSSRQKKIMQLRQGNRCANCGEPLSDGCHGDHRTPFSKGGETNLNNGAALCPACNLRKGASMPTTNQPIRLRQWQHEAHEQALHWYMARNKVFYIHACPGTGKTIAAIAILNSLLDERAISRVIVIAPSIEVVGQWARTYESITGRPMMRVTGADSDISGYGVDICATWQAVQGLQEAFINICAQEEVLITSDESHHAAEACTWGSSAESGFSDAKYVLILTGTPERSDDSRPIWFPYDDEGRLDLPRLGSYNLTYGEAIANNYCRPCCFHRHYGQFTVQVDDETAIEVSAGDDPDELSRDLNLPGLRRALDFYHLACTPQFEADGVTPLLTGYQASMFLEANKRLDQLRLEMPAAGGLVICPSVEMAEFMAELIEIADGEKPVLVHSRQRNSSEKIRQFRLGKQRWIVSVAMITEGVDIPRLRCLVYLPNAMTELSFRQSVGRVIRSAGPDDCTRAYVVMPEITAFDEYAKRIEKEAPSLNRPERPPAQKICPECHAPNALNAEQCEYCEFVFPVRTGIRLKTCPECAYRNKVTNSQCINCGYSFVTQYRMTLEEALRDGAVVRGMMIDEKDVRFGERYKDEIRNEVLKTGDATLISIINQIPPEGYGRLRAILNAIWDREFDEDDD